MDRLRNLPSGDSVGSRGPRIALVLIVALAAGAIALAARAGTADEAAVTVASLTGCERPYSDSSPWNTRLRPETRYHPQSAMHVPALGPELSSSPDQYTYPVYDVSTATPRRTVRISGWFSDVGSGGETLKRQRGGTVQMPVTAEVEAAAGSDGQIILIDTDTGEEWGAWRFRSHGDGSWSAQNAYRYNVGWDGVPPSGFISRGAGVTYLAGLVRPCEIARGRIDHALAFAYDWPTGAHVFPATKSDGASEGSPHVPEGARFQLDPRLTTAQIRSWGCTDACLTIARALQEYGMYTIDNSGRPKVMLEYRSTAHWPDSIGSKTVKPIPLSAFKLVEYCTITGTDGRDRIVGTGGRDYICALGGDDVIEAGGGDDIVYAGAGNDVILAGGGNDVVYASLGRDRVDLGRGRDRVLASAGDDTVLARDGLVDRISGGPGKDRSRADKRDIQGAVERAF